MQLHGIAALTAVTVAASGGAALVCNVSGSWCWLPNPAWPPFTFIARGDVDNGSLFAFQSQVPLPHPGAPWAEARGEVYRNGSVFIDYGCGTGPPCQVHGRVDAAGCNRIDLTGDGSYSRQCPRPRPQPQPPPLPEPRMFSGDARWLGEAAVYVLGSSRQPDEAGNALFAPNMQPGGYHGEFNRDYTYGLVHTPWNGDAAASGVWNLTLGNFLWASEQLLLGQRASDGQMPDVVFAAGGSRAGFNRCSDQACTFPPGSPLPRPACCGNSSTDGAAAAGGSEPRADDTAVHPRNCNDGSMDSAPFAVFNVIFLAEQLKASTGGPEAAGSWLGRWLPSLLRGLARVPGGPAASAFGSLAYNDPDDPIVGYGFEDSVAKTGALNYASLLIIEASALLCQVVRNLAASNATVAAHRPETEALCRRATKMSAELTPALWDDATGTFHPSTGLEGNLTDVWGSAYAASLDGVHTILGPSGVHTPRWPSDVPSPTTPAQRERIAAFLADPKNGVFANGQVRHLPIGQGWVQEWCVPKGATEPPGAKIAPPCAEGWLYSKPGDYQNGGFWATPVHHVWPLLHSVPATRSVACGLLRDFVSGATNISLGPLSLLNINEWVDGEGVPRGARGYVASAANAAAAARTMQANGGCADQTTGQV